MSEALRTDRTISTSLIDKLKDVVGPAGFLEGANDTDPYCQGWREDYHGAVPLVLRPQSTADVSRIVKLCAETGTAIVPQGGNTGLTGASQPHADMSEVIISTQRMNRDPRNRSQPMIRSPSRPGVILQDRSRSIAEPKTIACFPLIPWRRRFLPDWWQHLDERGRHPGPALWQHAQPWCLASRSVLPNGESLEWSEKPAQGQHWL